MDNLDYQTELDKTILTLISGIPDKLKDMVKDKLLC